MVCLFVVDLSLLLGFKEGSSDIMVYLLKNADDTLILAKLTFENLLIIKTILHIFDLACGLHIIFSKFSLIGVNVAPNLYGFGRRLHVLQIRVPPFQVS